MLVRIHESSVHSFKLREQTLEGYAFLHWSSFRFIYDEINSLGPRCFSRRLTKKLSIFRISASETIYLSYSFLLEHQDGKFIIFAEGIKHCSHVWACSPINQFPWLSQTLVYIPRCLFWTGKLSPFLNGDISVKLLEEVYPSFLKTHLTVLYSVICLSGRTWKNALLKLFVWTFYSYPYHFSLNSQLTFIVWNRLGSFLELVLRTNTAKHFYFLLFLFLLFLLFINKSRSFT